MNPENMQNSPHILASDSTRKIMFWVIISLTPIIIFSGYLFGRRVYLLYLIAILTCQLCEIIWFKLLHKKLTWDLSCVVTALLMTMNLPPSAPWYFPVIGGIFAIIVVKEFFGGLGFNFLNPALGGRALLVGLFFNDMFKISWPNPPFARILPEAVTKATPLAQMKLTSPTNDELLDSFLGFIGGRIGETSSLLILIGLIILLVKKIITLRIPLIIMGTVAVGAFIFSGNEHFADFSTVLGQILGGGLLLGAVFMATDYASSPTTKLGQNIYAFLIGVFIIIFRYFGFTNEGVSYAILTMNCATPFIDRIISRRVLGEKKTFLNLKIKS